MIALLQRVITHVQCLLYNALLIAIPRWKEVLDASVGDGVSQIQTLVDKMPDVAEVQILTLAAVHLVLRCII